MWSPNVNKIKVKTRLGFQKILKLSRVFQGFQTSLSYPK